MMMDSEPERCRRTDGRKWRCNKNVVPSHKYCERHMHRGSQGSRKHVEPPNSTALEPDNDIISDDGKCSKSPGLSDICHRDVDPCHGCLNHSLPSVLKCRSSEILGGALSIGSEVNEVVNCDHATTGIETSGGVVGALKGSDPIEGTADVLRLECNREAARCQRRDGKKWQCKRGALMDQKYCELHMHRGTKRRKLIQQQVIISPDCRKVSSFPIARRVDTGINLNAAPSSPGYSNSSGAASDATTITDESISFYLSKSSCK